MSKPQTLLIDGDILLYRFSCTNQFTINWDLQLTDLVSEVTDLSSAQFDTAMFIQRMSEKLKCEDLVVIFSGKNNFRYGVLPSYKHNRVGLVKPQLYAQLKEYMVKNYVTREKETLEGDDVMGILSTRWPGQFIIATIDKDLQQIPGKMFNWNTDRLTVTTLEEADRYFYKQILMGDSCDGYTGCPGIGPKKAEAILDDAHERWLGCGGASVCLNPRENYRTFLWGGVVATYASKGLTEADALQQARVARILRASDYDFKKKEIKLWTP